MTDVKFSCKVTMRHVDGQETDAETLLDAFAAAIGNQNGAMANALEIDVLIDYDDDTHAVYEVWLVEDV